MTAAAAVTTAASELLSQPCARLFVVAFTPDETRVARMRRITAAHLRYWNVTGELAKEIVVAVSELVTNAVQHALGDITFKVRYSADELRIEVTDGNPAPATMRPAGEDDESGRGLLMVAHFAQDWGASDDGETTWCVFRVPAGRS
ncbi:ATP-binding protein [Streptomyces sp. ISL-87]|nr:ATP-binding protein [Streptomyces sp. ISL-21]MBT2607734.1 ATP-binding protein [Streptomyces sp. ISL-87]